MSLRTAGIAILVILLLLVIGPKAAAAFVSGVANWMTQFVEAL